MCDQACPRMIDHISASKNERLEKHGCLASWAEH
jgi:hypothetical protein